MIVLLENDVYKLSAEENIEPDVYYLHFEYKLPTFTKSIYKSFIMQWLLIQDELKDKGIEEVKSIIPIEDDKTQKWQLMFGFEERAIMDSCIIYGRTL